MKKRFLIAISLCFTLLFAACSANINSNVGDKESKKVSESLEAGYPVTIKNYTFDKKEKDIIFKQSPKRVITTNQTTTELLLELGLGNCMVGTAYRDNPILDNIKEEYNKIPILSEKYPTKEVVIEKNPDLIIGWKSVFSDKALGSVESWNEKGINTFIQRNTGMTENATVENVYEDIDDIGKIFNIKEKTDKYIADMKNRVEKIHNSIKNVSSPVRVLVMEGADNNQYQTYGNNSLAADMVVKAGGKNLCEKGSKIAPEDIIALNPDVIVLINFETQVKDNKDADVLRNNIALKNVKAIKDNRIIYTPLAETYAGGVRTIDGIERLAKGFYPELIK